MSETQPSTSTAPSKDVVYLAVIVLLSIGCMAAVVVAMQESVARRRAEKALDQLRKAQQASQRETKKSALPPRKTLPRRAMSPSGKPYRSLAPPIRLGVLLGSHGLRLRGFPPGGYVSPRGVHASGGGMVSSLRKRPWNLFGPKNSRYPVRLIVHRGSYRRKGLVRYLPLWLFRRASTWPVSFLRRITDIEFKNISLKSSELLPLKRMISLRRLTFDDLQISGTLSARKHLPLSLRMLRFQTTSATLRGLCEGSLPALKELVFLAAGVNDRDLRCLARKVMPGLKRVTLEKSSHLSDRGLALLRNAAPLVSLKVRSCNGIVGMGLSALAAHHTLRKLVLTDLPKLEDQWLRYLEGLRQLRSLSLVASGIDGTGLGALAGLPHLETVQLQRSRLNDAGARALAGNKSIKFLSAQQTKITDAGVEDIATMIGLRRLVLSENKLGDQAVVRLQKLKQLRRLELYQTRVTDRAAPALANLPQLRHLNLGKTMMTSKGVAFLAANAKRLHWLRVSAMMAPAAFTRLRRLYPQLRIKDR